MLKTLLLKVWSEGRLKREKRPWLSFDSKVLEVDLECQVFPLFCLVSLLEMLKPTSALIGAGLGHDVALLTDGRFSGGSHGFLIGSQNFVTRANCRTYCSRGTGWWTHCSGQGR